MGLVESSGGLPSLPISPILSITPEDSVVGKIGSSRDEPDTPSGTDSLQDALLGYSPPELSRPILTSPAEVFSDLPDCPTSRDVRRSPGPVPRWRLAREGPFLSERSSSSLNCFGDGCAFLNTTYRPSDYTKPSGEFGVPLHHPRFLEWIGVPEYASLLEMGPGMWLHSLSRDQAMDAALQLHRDVCLMTTNLDYACRVWHPRFWNYAWNPGVSLLRRWLLVPWGPGPPSFCTDGGNGTVAAHAVEDDRVIRYSFREVYYTL